MAKGNAELVSMDADNVMVAAKPGGKGLDGASVWLCEGPGGSTGRIAAAAGDVTLPVGLTWTLDGPIGERVLQDRKTIIIDDLASSALVPEHLRPKEPPPGLAPDEGGLSFESLREIAPKAAAPEERSGYKEQERNDLQGLIEQNQ